MACWLTPAPPAAALLAGTNAMAGLVTRGCGEMRRMAVILGGQPRTLSGLSGVGDTFGTCFGPLSRNRNFGIRLGKGESMAEILASSTEVSPGVIRNAFLPRAKPSCASRSPASSRVCALVAKV